MDYQLAATKNVCANVGSRNKRKQNKTKQKKTNKQTNKKKKRFLNPPIGDMPITEENGRVTIGAS